MEFTKTLSRSGQARTYILTKVRHSPIVTAHAPFDRQGCQLATASGARWKARVDMRRRSNSLGSGRATRRATGTSLLRSGGVLLTALALAVGSAAVAGAAPPVTAPVPDPAPNGGTFPRPHPRAP